MVDYLILWISVQISTDETLPYIKKVICLECLRYTVEVVFTIIGSSKYQRSKYFSKVFFFQIYINVLIKSLCGSDHILVSMSVLTSNVLTTPFCSSSRYLWRWRSISCSSFWDKCSTIPAPKESPSTLTAVRKRSLKLKKKNQPPIELT